MNNLDNNKYKFGDRIKSWSEGSAKSVTLIVTEDCNFRCKYCYLVHKNTEKKMSLEIAQKVVDYILKNEYLFPEEKVIWEFMGGEAFLEIELVDQISDYIKMQSYLLKHKWFSNYRFNFSSNGALYYLPKVQKYIKKNYNHLSVGISIDGNEIKHNLNRIDKYGNGTYKDVVKNIPLWLEQFPNASTKSTFSSIDLPYLKDSIIHLWNLGIKDVNANCIFENDWKIGDDRILENQLIQLADYVIDNKLWNETQCSFFSDTIGRPLSPELLKKNWCGAGKMLTVTTDGKFYPCFRFTPFSLETNRDRCIGDYEIGIDEDKLRPFLSLGTMYQSRKECLECSVATGCAWCQGCNLDSADTDTIYQRATYICKMHKARCRANEYYWNRLEKEHRIQRKDTSFRS